MFDGWPGLLALETLVGLTCLHLVQLVLNFTLEKHHDNDDGDDVHNQNQPGACRPFVEHGGSSNWWADVDVHIASGLSDAAEAGSFFDQPVVKARWEVFRERNFTEDEADHAGAAGSGRAVRGESNATGFRMFNDGFTRINGALAQQVGSTEESDDRRRSGG